VTRWLPGARTVAGLVVAAWLALPAVAAACPSCLSSGYGDRTYNVAYLGLIITPFAVALMLGAVITRCWWTSRHEAAPMGDDSIDPQFNEGCEAAPVGCEAAPVEKT
jgi:hypothetical protein